MSEQDDQIGDMIAEVTRSHGDSLTTSDHGISTAWASHPLGVDLGGDADANRRNSSAGLGRMGSARRAVRKGAIVLRVAEALAPMARSSNNDYHGV